MEKYNKINNIFIPNRLVYQRGECPPPKGPGGPRKKIEEQINKLNAQMKMIEERIEPKKTPEKKEIEMKIKMKALKKKLKELGKEIIEQSLKSSSKYTVSSPIKKRIKCIFTSCCWSWYDSYSWRCRTNIHCSGQ